MAIHLFMAVFHLARVGGTGATMSMATPRIVASLIWPFLIKLCFLSVKVPSHDMVCSSRFFLFQITQILGRNLPNRHTNNDGDNNNNNNNNSRWNRAVRLVCQRVAQVRESSMRSLHDDDEHSLRVFSMLAL